jgi:hypothetical protein
MPARSERQSWRPFRRIFLINFLLFLAATALSYVFIELGAGGARKELLEDAIPGGILILSLSGLLAGWVAYLYRRTWNRRARKIAGEEADSA